MEPSITWAYYRFDPLIGTAPMSYYRYCYGITDRYEPKTHSWAPVSPDYLTRYLQTGEVGFDRVSKRTIESELGVTLPD